jgi:hypothetical protein
LVDSLSCIDHCKELASIRGTKMSKGWLLGSALALTLGTNVANAGPMLGIAADGNDPVADAGPMLGIAADGNDPFFDITITSFADAGVFGEFTVNGRARSSILV